MTSGIHLVPLVALAVGLGVIYQNTVGPAIAVAAVVSFLYLTVGDRDE